MPEVPDSLAGKSIDALHYALPGCVHCPTVSWHQQPEMLQGSTESRCCCRERSLGIHRAMRVSGDKRVV